jgi:hypothetical protein
MIVILCVLKFRMWIPKSYDSETGFMENMIHGKVSVIETEE